MVDGVVSWTVIHNLPVVQSGSYSSRINHRPHELFLNVGVSLVLVRHLHLVGTRRDL